MTKTKIFFTEEKNGYNRLEVDNYIAKLDEAYQNAYDENQDIRNKYNSLLDDCRKLDVQERTEFNSEIIAKTLVNAEVLAQKIIADANKEAVRIFVRAREKSK